MVFNDNNSICFNREIRIPCAPPGIIDCSSIRLLQVCLFHELLKEVGLRKYKLILGVFGIVVVDGFTGKKVLSHAMLRFASLVDEELWKIDE